MFPYFSTDGDAKKISIDLISPEGFNIWLSKQDEQTQAWIDDNGYQGLKNSYILIPNNIGKIKSIVVSMDSSDLSYMGTMATSLPKGTYELVGITQTMYQQAALNWGLGAYQFTKYKKGADYQAQLFLPAAINIGQVQHLLEGIYLVRDLVNIPCEDMSPEHLAHESKTLAKQFGAKFSEIVGAQLLSKNFPAIHAVGRASHIEPRLIEMNWGNDKHPHIILVGKGVCFDTGGYDLKSASGMRLMKKDMGGAAYVLGLAKVIMAEQLPIKLTVLISAVENVVAGNAYKPGDVVTTRQGLTVEIGNTDAEGRVVLSDALTYASEKEPALVIDFATLTGAAKVAVGSDLPAMFSNQDELAQSLQAMSFDVGDPMWQLPLYKPYRELLNSTIADMSNNASSPYGGAITAALFLQEFVNGLPWLHFDVMAYNLSSRPAHPEGGEAMGLRTVFEWLKRRYPRG